MIEQKKFKVCINHNLVENITVNSQKVMIILNSIHICQINYKNLNIVLFTICDICSRQHRATHLNLKKKMLDKSMNFIAEK